MENRRSLVGKSTCTPVDFSLLLEERVPSGTKLLTRLCGSLLWRERTSSVAAEDCDVSLVTGIVNVVMRLTAQSHQGLSHVQGS